jgi:small ligand-binding sensory domain FIST
MPYAAALSTSRETLRALDEVCTRALEELQATPDLALIFFSPHHLEAPQSLALAAQKRLAARCLLGCGGEAIVGNDQEIEAAPALSLWLASWSAQVELQPFHLVAEQTPDGLSVLGWPDALLSADPAHAAMLLLGDPFTFPTNLFLDRMNEDHPGLKVMGGMSSGGRGAGDTQLLLGNQSVPHGAVGVLLQGSIPVRSIVSQGCRPIGQHMVITQAQENIVAELGGQPPLARLQQLWQELSPRDQQLFQRGLHIGRVINEYQGQFQRGDFLVRNVLGLDRETGSLALTDNVRVGQTVQFHVRDAETADEDLHALLQTDVSSHKKRPGGALVFTCNGRGTRLFSEPHHDARVVRAEVGAVPLAGFFAMGELGPVGGQNFIHGFTASVVLFEEP